MFARRLGRLATEVGWKYGELVKKLEVRSSRPAESQLIRTKYRIYELSYSDLSVPNTG